MEAPKTLTGLIAAYHAAQQAYRDTLPRADDAQSPEWEAYEQAEAAVLRFPCQSIDDIRTKAAFVLADDNAFDTVENCVDRTGDEEVPSLRVFLRSLLGEAP